MQRTMRDVQAGEAARDAAGAVWATGCCHKRHSCSGYLGGVHSKYIDRADQQLRLVLVFEFSTRKITSDFKKLFHEFFPLCGLGESSGGRWRHGGKTTQPRMHLSKTLTSTRTTASRTRDKWQVATVDASAWRVLFHVLAVEPGDQRWRSEHLHVSREGDFMFSRCHPPTLWFGTNVGPWLLNESGVWRRQCRFPSGHWPSVRCWMSATRILRQTSEFHQVSHEHNSHYVPRDARCLWSFFWCRRLALGARALQVQHFWCCHKRHSCSGYLGGVHSKYIERADQHKIRRGHVTRQERSPERAHRIST